MPITLMNGPSWYRLPEEPAETQDASSFRRLAVGAENDSVQLPDDFD
jgi:hypothetical protein